MKGVYGLKIEALTNVGKVRKINEDSVASFVCDQYAYAIIADGMGGHLAGEVASGMAVDIIQEYIKDNITEDMDHFQVKEQMIKAFHLANIHIYQYSCENDSVMGMGTTTTMCMVRNGYVIFAHVGDSRAYLIDKKIKQITNDHSYVQELVKLGQITPEEAKVHPRRNYITRAMGVEETVKVDAGRKTYKGQKILICSDGLHGKVDDDEILAKVSKPDAKKSVKSLVKLANDRGGEDNISVVIMEGEESDA